MRRKIRFGGGVKGREQIERQWWRIRNGEMAKEWKNEWKAQGSGGGSSERGQKRKFEGGAKDLVSRWSRVR